MITISECVVLFDIWSRTPKWEDQDSLKGYDSHARWIQGNKKTGTYYKHNECHSFKGNYIITIRRILNLIRT
jgi:hypothetical protein